jgi:chromosome segregation ATPase
VASVLADASRFATAGGEGGVELAVDRATEALRRLLRAREGELETCERRIRDLEASQRELANELLAMTTAMDEAGDPRLLAAALRDLEDRHVAALELMGETSEENEELAARVEALQETLRAVGNGSS